MELKRFRDYYLTNDGRIFQTVIDDIYEIINDETCEQCCLKKRMLQNICRIE